MAEAGSGRGAQPFDLFAKRISGRHYSNTIIEELFNPTLRVSNLLRVSPFIVSGTNQTFDRIAVQVTGVGAGSLRMGIYRDTGSIYPGSLLLDAGVVDISTTGLKEIVIAQNLTPGLYWLADITDVNVTLSQTANSIGFSGGSAPTSYSAGYNTALAFGALPNPFPAGANHSIPPIGSSVTLRRA